MWSISWAVCVSRFDSRYFWFIRLPCCHSEQNWELLSQGRVAVSGTPGGGLSPSLLPRGLVAGSRDPCPYLAHHMDNEEAAPGLGTSSPLEAPSLPFCVASAVVLTVPGYPGPLPPQRLERAQFAISVPGCKFQCCHLLAERFRATRLNSLNLFLHLKSWRKSSLSNLQGDCKN